MSKPSKKQFSVVADQLARGLNYFEEIGVPFVFVMQGTGRMFSNVDQNHARAILDRQWRLNEKVMELEVEAEAERITAIPGDGGGGLKDR